MPNDTLLLLLSALWGLAFALLAWHIGGLAQQITYVTLADGRKQERRLPMLFRLLLPLAPNFTPWLNKPEFARMKETSRRRIVSAGFDGLLAPEEFLALHPMVFLFVGPLWVLFIRTAVTASHMAFMFKLELPLDLLGLVWLFFYPSMWLKRVLDERHRSIQKSLPYMLDLLTLSVEAGMDFMTALQRNTERRGTLDALGEELLRVIREIQIGKTRREALRDMSYRVNLADLRSVVNALIQADELGVSVGMVLRIQADQSRQRRFERAEKLANEAPIKMLFPLLFFIFPSVFIILLGPVITRLINQASL